MSPRDAQNAVIKAYRDLIEAEVKQAKAKLEVMEAVARQRKAKAQIATISSLKAAGQRIEARIEDLRAIHESHVSRAKIEIQDDVAKLETSIEELADRLKAGAAKK